MADLDGIMDLDYTLTKPPEFGMGYVDSFHKVCFSFSNLGPFILYFVRYSVVSFNQFIYQ